MDFLFPDVGEGITEGKLVKWLVKEGDAVRVDQPVAKVETDKAVVEIPCPASGTVGKLNFKEGDTMHVGKVLMTIEGASDTKKQDPQKQQEAQKRLRDKADISFGPWLLKDSRNALSSVGDKRILPMFSKNIIVRKCFI